MTSYADQMATAAAASRAVTSLETEARSQILQAFEDWDAGVLDAQTVRHKLEAIVRATYRASVAVGQKAAVQMSGMDDWKPTERVFLTDYLKQLLEDVRKNLREYKASDKQDAARRRAVLRMQHSAGVGAQRGLTDAMVAAGKDLREYGFTVRKVWMNSTNNNVPCPTCLALHGHQVEVDEDFPVPTKHLRVYINLQGPPRHPNCKCYIVIILMTLENALEELDIARPQVAPTQMSSKQIKSMPQRIFSAVVKVLRKILTLGRG